MQRRNEYILHTAVEAVEQICCLQIYSYVFVSQPEQPLLLPKLRVSQPELPKLASRSQPLRKLIFGHQNPLETRLLCLTQRWIERSLAQTLRQLLSPCSILSCFQVLSVFYPYEVRIFPEHLGSWQPKHWLQKRGIHLQEICRCKVKIVIGESIFNDRLQSFGHNNISSSPPVFTVSIHHRSIGDWLSLPNSTA